MPHHVGRQTAECAPQPPVLRPKAHTSRRVVQEPLTRRSGRTGMLRHCAIGTSGRSSTARRLESTSRDCAQTIAKRSAKRRLRRRLSLFLSSLSFSLSLLSFVSVATRLSCTLVLRTKIIHKRFVHAIAVSQKKTQNIFQCNRCYVLKKIRKHFHACHRHVHKCLYCT